jgi:hypothetical protein
MYTSDRTAHLDQLVANAAKNINETFGRWGSRPKTGPLGTQTAALDQFSAECAALAQLLELIGQRSSEVATEMLEDDES